MATLYVTEYAQVGLDRIMVEPANTVQTVSIGGSSTASSAFAANTNFVLLATDAICSIAFGSAPTASTTTSRMNANTERLFRVAPGHKVAVISNS